MLEYETHMELFDFLNLEEILKMHWINSVGWAMAQHMHNMVLEANIYTIIVVRYISLTCYEVSIIDNYNWLLVHGYVV
jgi:hypothetical protein